ncbi:hypothetical protein [Streptomyces griseus]|uniref:hypothetical protein n=1 Tax=Streptomyces griseus TaxID=1911 RepID=UPI003650DE23
MTQVLHMGPMAGPILSHHNLGRNVGFDANLYAYSLRNGDPGRPFVRFADGDDTAADWFDTHNVETLRQFQEALVLSLAGLFEFTRRIQEWDRAASTTAQEWDEEARHDRPCQGHAGQGERCPLCHPAGATPGQRLWLDLMSASAT